MRTRREFLKAAAITATAGHVIAAAPAAWSATPVDVSGAQSLRAHAEALGLLIGCAVVPERLQREPQYASVVAAQANILVAENAMKWKALRPASDKFDFNGADAILAFASAHQQKVRGHNLCWHEGLPDWFAGTVTKENARQILTDHIKTVAGHYAGELHSWDVVNEAIDTKSDLPDGLRKSPWLELIGPDYIDVAFRRRARGGFEGVAHIQRLRHRDRHSGPDEEAHAGSGSGARNEKAQRAYRCGRRAEPSWSDRSDPRQWPARFRA